MNPIIYWLVQILLTPACAPLLVGIVRKAKARMQNRVGASISQPYRDLVKLFRKDETVSKDASWVFSFAPYVIFGVTLVVGASIPLIAAPASGNPLADLLTILYVLALGVFFIALAGLDVGSAFGGFGSSREMTLSALAEGGMIFSLFALAFLAHSTNLFVIAGAVAALPLAALAPLALLFPAFFLALLAENGRFPFDNPATHLELTMIHEAMILEYSGKKLALIEWASANKFFIFVALAANLFFPFGGVFGAGALAMLAFFVKVLAIALAVAVLESVIAKYRFFRLPDLLLTSLVLSAIALILIV